MSLLSTLAAALLLPAGLALAQQPSTETMTIGEPPIIYSAPPISAPIIQPPISYTAPPQAGYPPYGPR